MDRRAGGVRRRVSAVRACRPPAPIRYSAAPCVYSAGATHEACHDAVACSPALRRLLPGRRQLRRCRGVLAACAGAGGRAGLRRAPVDRSAGGAGGASAGAGSGRRCAVARRRRGAAVAAAGRTGPARYRDRCLRRRIAGRLRRGAGHAPSARPLHRARVSERRILGRRRARPGLAPSDARPAPLLLLPGVRAGYRRAVARPGPAGSAGRLAIRSACRRRVPGTARVASAGGRQHPRIPFRLCQPRPAPAARCDGRRARPGPAGACAGAARRGCARLAARRRCPAAGRGSGARAFRRRRGAAGDDAAIPDAARLRPAALVL